MITFKQLHPTLWRTCRMLSGSTRIRLLRQLHAQPGQNVAGLAEALDISRPFASQELRRIQSRGFLNRTHQGSSIIYRLGADPQVSTAAPLLKAVLRTLDSTPGSQDSEIRRIAAGPAHERRIALIASLLRSPRTSSQLRVEVPMSACSLKLHLRKLTTSGLITNTRRQYYTRTPRHPLGRALMKLLRQGISI